MFKNILLVAYRHLTRQLSYSLINVIGLAIGIACSLVIILFVYGEWSYDRGFTKADRIYRIGISFFNIGKFANGPEELLDVLPKEFAGIETATRVWKERNLILTANDQTFTEPFAYFVDTAYFKLFEYDFISGNKEKVLAKPNEVVMSRAQAIKYFGTEDVLGKVLEVGKEREPFTVTGVVEELGFNSHLNSQLWFSVHGKISGSPVWSSATFYNYVLLRENLTEADLSKALDKTIETHVFPESGQPMGFKMLEDYLKNENAIKFYIHPLKDIYLKSKLNLEISPGGEKANIFIFSAISIFILALAAVNFVNLTTARASRRAKEVGIRKTMGTSRGKLVGQFLLESMLTSTLAMFLALLLAELFLVVFEYVTGSPLLTTIWRSPVTVLMFFGFSIVVGFLSGIYPAFYLTSFTPVKVLKGNLVTSGGGGFRNFLVVFQFSVSMVLIISAAIVQQQLHFIQTKDLGFDQENILTIDNSDLLGNSAEAFKNELSAQAGVINSSYHMGEPGSKRILSFYTYQTPAMQSAITINTFFGDADYMSVLGMRLVKGRGFDRNLASDTSSVILNEAAVKALDLGDEPIGAKVNEHQTIIGVVSDFHWESLRTSIAPLSIVLSKERAQLGFKLEAQAIPGFLKAAEAKWKQTVPDEPFRYHFMDDNFGELLQKEAVFGKSINVFTLLAIFISCLGLYGLSAYTAEQRTKEIGIRKVLGASASNIVVMLNRKFTVLVLVAVLISIPLSFYIGQQWLQGFAYHIQLGVGVFLLAVVASLCIAWLTVGYHSLKASLINPSETLKYE
jgi:putative ABC transport system permease protein